MTNVTYPLLGVAPAPKWEGEDMYRLYVTLSGRYVLATPEEARLALYSNFTRSDPTISFDDSITAIYYAGGIQ